MMYDKATKDLGLIPESEGESPAPQASQPPSVMTSGGGTVTTPQTAAPLAPPAQPAAPVVKVAPKKKEIPIDVLDALRKKYKGVPDDEFRRQWELTQK